MVDFKALLESTKAEAAEKGITVAEVVRQHVDKISADYLKAEADKQAMPTIVLANVNAKRYYAGIVYSMCAQPIAGCKNLDIFTPTKAMVYGHKKFAQPNNPKWNFVKVPVSDEEYTAQYLTILERNKAEIIVGLKRIKSKVTFLCYCLEGEFCHRRILAEWLKPVLEEIGRADIQIELH